MRLIKLTSIEGRDIAIVANDVMYLERGDYLRNSGLEKYGFQGRPTRVIMKNFNYSVREDFETVCTLVEAAMVKGEDNEND